MSILQMKVLPKAEQNTVHWAWKKSDCWRKQMSVKTSNGKLNSQLSTEESWNQFWKKKTITTILFPLHVVNSSERNNKNIIK